MRILGNYEIIEKIGSGGMGAVYKARQLSMDRMVAMKILPKDLAKNKDFVQRFLREAQVAGKCSHPNLIHVHEVGYSDGYYFYSMELVDGPTLEEIIEEKGPLSESTAVEYMIGIASALKEAHGKGIVHRDVKPANILITKEGVPKLSDLGLAKPMSGRLDVTMGGRAIGSPHYMSPEQIQGKDVDGRSDLYSLGATFYQALTGRPVFDAPTLEGVVTKHVTEKPVPVRDVRKDISSRMDAVVMKLLEKRPEDRYQSAEQLLEDLFALKEGKRLKYASPAVAVRERKKTPRPGQRRPAATVSAGSGRRGILLPFFLLAAGVVVVLLWVVSGGRGGGQQGRTAASTGTEAVGSQRLEARRAYEEAMAFAKSHRKDYGECIRRLESVWRRYPSTLSGRRAKEEADRLRREWKSAAEAAWNTARARAGELCSKGDFDGARRVLKAVAETNPLLDGKTVKNALKEVDEKADDFVARLADEAERCLKEKRFEECRRLLKRIEGVKDARSTEDRRGFVAEMEETLAHARIRHEREETENVKKKVLSALYESVGLMVDGKADVAIEKLKGLGDVSGMPLLKVEVDLAKKVASCLGVPHWRLRRVLEKKKGEHIEVVTRQGRVAGVLKDLKGNGIVLELVHGGGGGTVVTTRVIDMSELDDGFYEKTVSEFRPRTDAERIAVAILALRNKDFGEFESALEFVYEGEVVKALRRYVKRHTGAGG